MRPRDPLFVYTLNQSMHWFAVGLTFPILVLILLEKDMGLAQVGVAIALYSATTLLLELPTGGLADTLGRKKVYMISVAFTMASGIALLLSWDFYSAMVAVFLSGTGRALSSGSMDAWFVDSYKEAHPDGNLQRALAKAGIFIPLAIGAGALMGGLVPTLLGSFQPSFFHSGPYTANLLIQQGIWIMQLFLTMFLVREVWHDRSKDGKKSGLSSTLKTSIEYGVRNRTMLLLILAMVFFGFGIAGMELLWQPFVNDLTEGTSSTWVLGVLAAGYFFASSVGNAASMSLCRALNERYSLVLVLVRIATGLVLVIVALQTEVIWFAVFYLFLYFVASIGDTVHGTLYNENSPSGVRATLLSFQSLALQLGAMAGSLILGFLAEDQGISFSWTVAGIVLMVSSVTYLSLQLMERKKK